MKSFVTSLVLIGALSVNSVATQPKASLETSSSIQSMLEYLKENLPLIATTIVITGSVTTLIMRRLMKPEIQYVDRVVAPDPKQPSLVQKIRATTQPLPRASAVNAVTTELAVVATGGAVVAAEKVLHPYLARRDSLRKVDTQEGKVVVWEEPAWKNKKEELKARVATQGLELLALVKEIRDLPLSEKVGARQKLSAYLQKMTPEEFAEAANEPGFWDLGVFGGDESAQIFLNLTPEQFAAVMSSFIVKRKKEGCEKESTDEDILKQMKQRVLCLSKALVNAAANHEERRQMDQLASKMFAILEALVRVKSSYGDDIVAHLSGHDFALQFKVAWDRTRRTLGKAKLLEISDADATALEWIGAENTGE